MSDNSSQRSSLTPFPVLQIDPISKVALQVVIDDTIISEFASMPLKPSQLSPKDSPDDDTALETSNCDCTPQKIRSTLSIHDRYGFSAIFGDTGDFIGYAKWDLVSRCLHSTIYYPQNVMGGEPMLLRAKSQTDGNGEEEVVYVGSYVYNELEHQSSFLLFHGETNEQVCRLKMPSRVPFGFHGQFFSGDELASHFQYHKALEKWVDMQCPIQWIHFFIRDLIHDYSPSLDGKHVIPGEVEHKALF